MSQQPVKSRSACRNFLIKILQSALRKRGGKSTEIEEGLRRVSSPLYNNECLIARRPCGQVQPRLARNENVKTESNANEQQKIFPFSHFPFSALWQSIKIDIFTSHHDCNYVLETLAPPGEAYAALFLEYQVASARPLLSFSLCV